MTSPSLLSNRYVRIGVIAVVLLVLLSVILAPATGQKTSGSTYNRAPEGYLGWFRYMEDQDTPVQRWQRPLEELEPDASEPQTLLRVYSGLVYPYAGWSREWLQDWLAAGNDFVALGINEAIREAPFRTRQASPQGTVIIKTRRRHSLSEKGERGRLGDDFGAIVWQKLGTEEEGSAYFAVTPHLAANAYLDAPGNYAFLTDLVSQSGGTIWVDEYLHGYKDVDVIVEETVNSWIVYLARTPVKIAFVQLAILLGILLVSHNRRLGNLKTLSAPQVDNSQAYIEALAAVLHKAESTSFLVDMITKAERSSLRKSLGLSETGVDDATLKEAWTQQTGQPGEALTPLLNPSRRVRKSADQTLNQWLMRLLRIRQTPIR